MTQNVTPALCCAVLLLSMEFQKGTFIIVPNKHRMSELSSSTQLIWVWLCAYANEDGECYPSRTTLSKNINKDVRTVDRSIKELLLKGWMKKKPQYRNSAQTSNLYILWLLPVKKGGDKNASPRGDKNATGGGDKNASQNSTIINSTN